MSSAEIGHKLNVVRQILSETGAAGVRLRGTDWFAWATAGGSNAVLLAAETGIAEVFITASAAWILTDTIEAQRLQDEEVSAEFQIAAFPWTDTEQRDNFVTAATDRGQVCSDRPTATEAPLPDALIQHKRVLLPSEIDRYRQVGQLASIAMTEALTQAQPDWTESQLAGAGAAALWQRGLHPALTLVAGERRLPLYRHATAKSERLGNIAMLVFCARGFGLYANLTRFVGFGQLAAAQAQLHQDIREIEAIALDQCQVDTPLDHIYRTLQQAYEQQGYPTAIAEHHQGGTTGYLSREVIATPQTRDRLVANMAMAWNPSLTGAKIEDTFLLHGNNQLENLTLDPNWATVTVHDRPRPLPLMR
ncbi:M24 family metallopeptidase [Pantanalinema rosaneae CENA516]|uniref:M24 family metallopeptidase n=1 Tax=Pantanalinema rosaneae TaxID=1620701 RepID=UPI003D6EFF39